jgi:hypothetical protein
MVESALTTAAMGAIFSECLMTSYEHETNEYSDAFLHRADIDS